MPYRDAWDTKGPAAFLSFALVQWILGPGVWAIRIFDLVILAIGTATFGACVRRFTGPRTAAWAAILFVLWYLSATFYATAQPDGWAALFLVAAVCPLLREDSSFPIWRFLLAGVLIGACSLVKPTYVPFLVVPLLSRGAPSASQLLSRFGALVVGFVGVVSPVIVWLYVGGALGEYWNVHFAYSSTVYADGNSLQLGPRMRGLAEHLLTAPIVVVLVPAALLGGLGLIRRNRWAAVTVCSWLALGIATVLLQNKFFIYHWLIPFPPLAILAAVGLHEVLAGNQHREPGVTSAPGARSDAAGRGLGAALFAVIVLHCAVHPAFEAGRGILFVTGAMSGDDYYRGFGFPGADREAARYLKQRAPPEATIAIWGLNTDVIYMSGHEPPGRFAVSYPPLLAGPDSEFRKRYRTEFLEVFDRRPPLYVLLDERFDVLLGVPATLDAFPELRDRVDRQYVEETRFGPVVLLRRRDNR